jgi:NADH-quinone oxidoreductase subunit L
VTAGFYSKEWILSAVATAPNGNWLWIGGVLGAFVTGVYSFRLIFRVFFGDVRTEPTGRPGHAMTVPLLLLAAASVVVGFLQIPRTLGDVTLFSRYLAHSRDVVEVVPHQSVRIEAFEQLAVSVASLGGIALAAWLFLRRRETASFDARAANRLLMSGWGFDALYDRAFVRPWHAMTRTSADAVDRCYGMLADAAQTFHAWLSRTQTGLVRWYAASLGAGAVLLLGWFAL